MAIRGINTVTKVQATLQATKSITSMSVSGATLSVASTSHGYANGDVVILALTGLPQLDGMAARVTNQSANAWDVQGVDATGWGTLSVTGTSAKVLTWDTFDTLTQLSLPNSEPNRLDATTIHDSVRQEVFGLAGNVTGTLSGQFKPLDTAVTNLRTASLAASPRAFLITFENQNVCWFNADVAGGMGFELGQNSIATASYSLTIKKRVCFAAS